MSLVRAHGIDADAIDHVTVAMNDNARRIVDNRSMHNICIQDMLAANLASGGLRLDDEPFPAILNDPKYQALRPRISVESDVSFKDEDVTRLGARVTIATRDGQEVSTVVRHPRGYDSQGRIGWTDLEEKWSGILKGCDLEGALALAKDLEDLEDIALLASRFATAQP